MYVNGSQAVGYWVDDVLTDCNKYVDRHKNVYAPLQTGKFIDGKLFGEGTISFYNGDHYRGMFKDGNRCGNGVLEYKNLPVYERVGTDEGNDVVLNHDGRDEG